MRGWYHIWYNEAAVLRRDKPNISCPYKSCSRITKLVREKRYSGDVVPGT
jgi:hypothetical protein